MYSRIEQLNVEQQAYSTQPEARTFRERALRTAAGIGFIASSFFAFRWTVEIGTDQTIGLVDSTKFALEFGANFALAGLSTAVLNKSQPQQ